MSSKDARDVALLLIFQDATVVKFILITTVILKCLASIYSPSYVSIIHKTNHSSSSVFLFIKFTEKRDITYSYLYLKDNVLGKVQELIFGPSACQSLPRLHQMSYELTSRVVGGHSAIYGSQPWQVL